MKDPAERVCLG